jgi:hypothetical protein
LVERLASCRTRLGKWHRVVKPTLKELGLRPGEIDQIWAALRDDKVTLELSVLFCARWQIVHAETLEPAKILVLLTGKSPQPTTSEVNLVSAR